MEKTNFSILDMRKSQRKNHDEETNVSVQVQIQKTLVEIDDVTLRIKEELDMINGLVKDGGKLQTAVASANETLAAQAKGLGLNVKDIVSQNENEDGARIELTNVTLASIAERIRSLDN